MAIDTDLINDFQLRVYTLSATNGKRTNEGPDQTAFDAQSVLDDIAYSLEINDEVRAEYLLQKLRENF